MSFNIFDSATKDSIRVGYIDPDRGYLPGKSIYEANVHASKNPGAVFILETRDRVRYLTINEINNLTVQDITPDKTSCQDGIKGLRPGETAAYPNGSQPIIVSGKRDKGSVIDPVTGRRIPPRRNGVKVGATGGTQLTVGGVGGKPVSAGGKELKSGGGKVKYGATGGTPVVLGGSGGTPVLLDKEPLSINGIEVFAGGQGGDPITFGGRGGKKLKTDGAPNACESKIFISGSGGVGAFAVPVIGIDGSVLAAIVTDGGFGYKSPPQARLFDSCRRGVGTVLKTIIGETASKTIFYDQEDDFEVYNLTPPFTLSGYGKRFGPDGEELGDWDPNLFASLEESPIGRQIRDYQDFLKQLTQPWWHTRKETPLEVIFRGSNNQVKHDVKHWAWGGKIVEVKQPPTRNDQLEELEFEVYTQGGNQADRDLKFTFTSEDGSHKFQFKAPEFREDRKTKVKRQVKRNTKYRVTASGRYKGKGVEQGLVAGIGRRSKEIKGNKKGTVIFADFVKSSNDNDDLQVRATQGKFTATGERKTTDGHSTNDLTFEFESGKDFVPTPSKKKKEIEDSFMNRYAISPTPPSNVPGSDYAGRVATFIWEENFPYSGDYKFRGMADNVGKIYLDNELVLEERRFKGDPTRVVSRHVTAGVHEIKVELFNIPIKERPKPKAPGMVPVEFEVYGQGSKSNMAISFVFTANDHSFTIPNVDKSNSTSKRTINLKPNVDYKVTSILTGNKTHTSKTVDSKREFNIDFDGLNRANNPIEVSGKNSRNRNNTLKLKDGGGSDTNAKFTIMSASPGLDARFSDDGKKLVVRGDSGGDVTLKLNWDDNPRTKGVAVKSIKILGETWRQRGEKGQETKTIKLGKPTKELEKSAKALEQGLSKVFGRGKKGTERGEGTGQIVFADYIGSANDNDDMQIKCNSGSFTSSNKRRGVEGTSGQGTQKRNTYDLSFRVNAKASTGGDSTQTQKYESIFNTADYVNKADRKLWRTNVYGRRGFLSENGICPFDTKKPLDNNPYAGTHVIRWEHVDFPNDGNYEITVDADDNVKIFIGNRVGDGAMAIGNGLRDIEKGGDEVIIENGMNKQTYTRFFQKGKYRIRTELTQVPGGVFTFDKSGKAGGADVTARFIERAGKNYLKVEGTGSAEIHFRLRTDDDPGNSGSFASKLRIGLPPNDFLELKRGTSRGRLKEKETINGSAFFESGREYLIETFNSNKDTGFRIKNKGRTIEYDDNVSNGFDENADLSITKITNQQKPKIKGVNPMALAIDIKAKVAEEPRISARSWYQNPMGAAFTIDAPLPPIPQEPPVQQEGRCPNNPLWSSRFAGGSESWWPVTHPAWSKFTNRFAMSPLPPLSTKNSDGGGGIVYSNTWQVDFPYNGFYGFKGSGDNRGRILIDGEEVYQLKGFKNSSPKIVKRKITEGNHEVTLEIENQDQRKRKKVKKTFFNTQDWVKKEKGSSDAKVPVKFDVYGQGSKSHRKIKFTFTSEDGRDTFTFNPGEISGSGNKYSYDRTVNVLPNVNYRVQAVPNGQTSSGNRDLNITYDGLNSANRPIDVSGSGKTIKLKDGDGNDTNAKFRIMSTSSGVSADFSQDGGKLKIRGGGDGNVTLRLEWDDNPGTAGVAVRSITVGGKTWRQSGRKGDQTETIRVSGGSGGGFNLEQGTLKKGSFTKGGRGLESSDKSDIIFADVTTSSNDNDDMQIRCGTGEFTPSNRRRIDGHSTYDLTFKVKGFDSGFNPVTSVGGVKYSGPELFKFTHPAWSKLMNNISVSPYTPPLNTNNPNINGTFTLKWSGVKFSENGRYDIAFQADNIAKLFINGTEIQEVRSFRGEPKPRYVELSRGTYDVEIRLTNIPTANNTFQTNPSGVALKITKDVTIVSSDSQSWLNNPVGASAIIIPPPCPKEIAGTGFVEKIEVIEPGNGHPPPEFPEGGGTGIPVTLQLTEIVPTATGIGYKTGDRIIVEVPDRPPIEFEPELDKFGRITRIPVTRFPLIPPPGDRNRLIDPPPDGDPTGFDVIGNSETQILQVKDLPGDIGVADDTGVLIPLIPSGGGTPEGGGTIVPAPGPFYGFTEFPNIYPTSNTGLGFRGRPVFEVVVVPENILPDESVLQVVDLPGLRKTGYVNGKPYYGQVFAKDGNLYAGISETIGQLVPVYATLQESILNRQTIEPSAILRTGTETNSNDPTLNIPNTPDNLI